RGALAILLAGDRRVGRLEVEPGPGHAVVGRVDFEPEPGEYGEAEDAVDRRAGESQGVHADELKRVLHPGLEVLQPGASLDLEAFQRRPEIVLRRLQADRRGGFGADVKGRRAGVDQEVERSLAVEPDPD